MLLAVLQSVITGGATVLSPIIEKCHAKCKSTVWITGDFATQQCTYGCDMGYTIDSSLIDNPVAQFCEEHLQCKYGPGKCECIVGCSFAAQCKRGSCYDFPTLDGGVLNIQEPKVKGNPWRADLYKVKCK